MEVWTTGLPVTVALSVVAAIGYLIGRRQQPEPDTAANTPSRELHRASIAATQLEAIVEQLRKGLATHHASVRRFQQRISSLSDASSSLVRNELCEEAEEMLKPTLLLAAEIAEAYSHIRSQADNLMTFPKLRTDPLTGVGNRRALNESLKMMFRSMRRRSRPFSLAIFEIDQSIQTNNPKACSQTESQLRLIAELINDSVREADVVTRYGGKEFVVVLSDTKLAGATRCERRIRYSVRKDLKLMVHSGVVQAGSDDDAASLLIKADKALYAAKAAGANRFSAHDGRPVRRTSADSLDTPAECDVSSPSICGHVVQ